jgi:threonine/homoserine/homoserine lactone efflux protein
MLIVPGPTILTVIAYASSQGKQATLPLVAAVSLGDISVIGLSVVGLSSLLAVSATAFTAIKVVGGLYLLFIGVKIMTAAAHVDPDKNLSSKTSSGSSAEQSERQPSTAKTANIFFNTWLVTALNPKGIIFFTAFLPQFIQMQNPVAPQLAILSITFVCLAAMNTLTYAVLANKASRRLSSKQAKKRFDIGAGLLMSAAGIWALTAKQST